MTLQFFLGCPNPVWLSRIRDAPLFVSNTRLKKRKSLPRAAGVWALDSGGFTELQRRGRWTVSIHEYIQAVRRYRDEIGGLQWCAPMDWMCEPIIINGGYANGQHFVGTHLSIEEHQHRTVANYLELCNKAPDLPVIPVLQGWECDDYLRCVEMYLAADIDLMAEQLVGLGTVCRRQGTKEAVGIIATLAGLGIKLHGFGFKLTGLKKAAHMLESADSMSWSYAGRRTPDPTGHCKNLANDMQFALDWHARVIATIDTANPGQYQMAI
jgi:hypothetical protein